MPREKSSETTSPTRKRTPRKGASPPAAELVYPGFVDPQQRAALIARAAYFRAMNRGFDPGYELEDWLSAEAEVDAELMRGTAESARV
jgi:hypothetical protein